MDYEFLVDGKIHRLALKRTGSSVVAVVEGRSLELDVLQATPDSISMLAGAKSCLARVARAGDTIHVAIGGRQFRLEAPGEGSSPAGGETSGTADGIIRAPMPGTVIKVSVAPGAEVQPGEGLVVIEAMKMEHEMRAAFRAVVDKIHVQAGQQVDALQPLLELKPLANGA